MLVTVVADSSNLSTHGISLVGEAVWIAGTTTQADVPITPGAPVPSNLKSGFAPAAYLGMVDFSRAAPPGLPQLACVPDAADGSHAGPSTPNQVLSLFGNNLGPLARRRRLR